MIFLAYVAFKDPSITNYLSKLGLSAGYILIFIAGMLFSFGFTAPFAVGFFIVLQPQNLYLAVLLGGLGALTSDLLIFNLIKVSFMDEFEQLKKEKTMKRLNNLANKTLENHIRLYLLYFIAGFAIASPLPDEFGVMMIAGLTKIKQSIFSIISFTLNSLGIFLIILFSH